MNPQLQQVGAPDPELKNSPIIDEDEELSLDADNGIVTVTTGLTTRRAELGHAPADAVARLLLKEIVEERKRSA